MFFLVSFEQCAAYAKRRANYDDISVEHREVKQKEHLTLRGPSVRTPRNSIVLSNKSNELQNVEDE